MELELQRKLVTQGLTPSAQPAQKQHRQRKVELTQAWESPLLVLDSHGEELCSLWA